MMELELQSHGKLTQKLSEYKTFLGFKVLNAYEGANDLEGLRVVRKNSTKDSHKDGYLGTIESLDDKTNQVVVQWDKHDKKENEKFGKKENNQYELLLFDNAQKGVKHGNTQCNACTKYPLRGIRWKCMTCAEHDLCTKCYMNNEHYLHHIFKRILSTNLKGELMDPRRKKIDKKRSSLKGSVKTNLKTDINIEKTATGIIIGADVQLRGDSKKKGTVIEICDNEKIKDSNKVKVMWKDDTVELEKEMAISELLLESGGKFSYYPGHLPVLGQYTDGYLEANIDQCENEKANNKIKVFIWRTKQDKTKKMGLTLKPSMYLIFDCPEEQPRDGKMAHLEEVFEIAKKTKLPCHIVGQRVLFHSGSSNTACIHYKTSKDTVQELIRKGFNRFERGDEDAEDEINYFKRMAEYAIGGEVLPVIISIRNGGIKKQWTDKESKKTTISEIPIIRLKNNTKDVSVLWPTVGKEDVSHVEYKTDNKKPWRVKKSNLKKKYSELIPWVDDIEFISETQVDLDILICYLIVGVCFEEDSSTDKHKWTFTNDYRTALSVHLLQKEKWTINKQYVKKPFSHQCLEYIYEEVMTPEFKDELWSNQKSFSKMGYQLPEYIDIPTESASANTPTDSKEWEKKEKRLEAMKNNVDCYGLLFFALLQRQYWTGALQLVETGFIGIHYVLFGCVILEDEINSGQTTTLLKEKLQRLKSAFTDKATRITSCIYEGDMQKKDDSIEREKTRSETANEERELGDCVDHAARLLLNHGYLRDAIRTENSNFLEDDTVKAILNKMFCGTERVNWRTTFCYIILAAVHMIVLPFLMINMEARPLLWFYKKYKMHFMKVYIHMVGFLVLLMAYSYMLLFDYRDDGFTYTDYLIIAWMASFFVDETKQVIVAFVRGKWRNYSIDWWNLIDWMVIIVCTSGMLLKSVEGSGYRNISRLLLFVAFTALCIRLLHLSCMTEFLGRKLVLNRKMIKDTSAFMIIISIIMLWYSISFYSLLYPNSEFTWIQIEQILRNGYWMLFGDLHLDVFEPDCTNNKTIYEIGIIQRCPSQLGLYITPYLKAFYGLIAVVLLLNLLIAMYSDTYNKVQLNANLSWLQMQTDLFEEYSIKTIFPTHLQLLALPGTILAILWVVFTCLRRKWNTEEARATLNYYPMFVRVFLYDTNYDVRLESTYVAEEKGVLEAKGKIELADSEAITIMARLQNIEDSLRDLQDMKTMLFSRTREDTNM